MTDLYKKLEARVEKFRKEHPEIAEEADKIVREHPEIFLLSHSVPVRVTDIPMSDSLCEDELIQHVGYTPEICGYEK